MAQKPSLRAQEAFDAIEFLVKNGLVPTHQAVRERVGGRGSPPVISRYISEWYAENGHAFIANAEEIRRDKPVTSVTDQMMETAGKAAKLVSDAERERQEALDVRAQQLEAAEQALEARERVLLEQQEKLADRELEQSHLIAELRSDKASVAAGLAQAHEDRLRTEAELAKATAALASVNAQLTQAVQDTATAEERARSSAGALEETRHSLTETVRMVDAYQASHAEAMAEVRRLQQYEREQRQALHAQVDQAEQQLQQLQAQLHSGATELKQAAGRESVLQERLAESSKALAAALQESHALASAMAGHLRTVDQLREERDQAARHAASLAESLAVIAANLPPPTDSQRRG